MTPYTTAQEQRIAAHAARVALEMGELRQPPMRPPGKPTPVSRQKKKPKTPRDDWRGRPRPVVSDRGEWFPSVGVASLAFGMTRTAVSSAMYDNRRCAERRWRYATEEETARQGRAA